MIRLDDTRPPGSQQELDAARQFMPIPANGVCSRLGDKWTVHVLWRLSLAAGRRLRFSALKKETVGITQRMLTLTLRNLERDGLIVRHYFPEVPPRVEYELTDMGVEALAALQSFNLWLRNNLPQIEEHRRAYDEAGDNP